MVSFSAPMVSVAAVQYVTDQFVSPGLVSHWIATGGTLFLRPAIFKMPLHFTFSSGRIERSVAASSRPASAPVGETSCARDATALESKIANAAIPLKMNLCLNILVNLRITRPSVKLHKPTGCLILAIAAVCDRRRRS
jgi:hypothetical protein